MSAVDYRLSVGVMLVNKTGQVFMGARIDNTDDAWQMPQGGLDEGEEPFAAALRELEEETGIAADKVQMIAESREWLSYDLPEDLQGKVWGGQYKGQKQKWFLCLFTGEDTDINIATSHPEFRDWRWVTLDEVAPLIVEFKRDLYQNLVDHFRPMIAVFVQGGE